MENGMKVKDLVKQLEKDYDGEDKLTVANIVWQSTLTDEMISHLSEIDTNLLIKSLDEAVEQVCDIYEIKE